MKHIKKLWIIFVVASILSCNSDDNNDQSNCSNIGCTEIFITITVAIEDQNQTPVTLDSFQVINLDTGEDMTPELSPSELEMIQETGQYPIANDNSFGINQEETLQLRGFINNEEVINSNYMVQTDCCHISLQSGQNPFITE